MRHVGRRDFSRTVDANVDVDHCCLVASKHVNCWSLAGMLVLLP